MFGWILKTVASSVWNKLVGVVEVVKVSVPILPAKLANT